MSSFTAKESYKLKCAKEIFKQWCYSSEWNKGFSTYVVIDAPDKTHTGLGWDSTEDSHAYLNYPIVKNEEVDSITHVPTRGEGWVDANNWCPSAIVDIVLPHKGSPMYFIVLSPLSEIKIKLLRSLGVENLIEVDADWILSQTSAPSKLKIKKWLC